MSFQAIATTGQQLLGKNFLTQNAPWKPPQQSTGEYWKPIYNILEFNFEVMVVNAQHLKNVPGRKTDVKDAEWIADLLKHGLLRGSFIPRLLLN